MGDTQIRKLCSELEVLLAPQFPGQAKVAAKLGEAVAQGGALAGKDAFASLDMWGGSGSVADVYFEDEPSANSKLTGLLVELGDAFEHIGVTSPRARGWTETFRYWQDSGIR